MTNPIVPSITDEQLEEIEHAIRLTLSSGASSKSAIYLANTTAAIIARLRAAEADAKRYRYMRASAQRQWRNGPGLYWYLHRHLQGSVEEQLDASIDAAMRESQQWPA